MKLNIANRGVARILAEELNGTSKPANRDNSHEGIIVTIPISPDKFWGNIYYKLDASTQLAVTRRNKRIG